jgi:sirohydrochlorin cobaltochelatase
MLKSIVVFAHGSRDPLWHEPIKAVAQAIQTQRPHVLVRCAYLEMTEPNLNDCARELVSLGVGEMCLFPLFLGVGRHAREDLPEQIQSLKALYPNLKLTVMPSAGEMPEVVSHLANMAIKHLSD